VALCFDGQDSLVFERTTGISGGEGVWTRKVQPTGSVGTTRSLVFSTSPLFGAYGKLAASYSGTRGFLAYSGYTATAAPMGGTTVTSRFSYATELPPPPQGAVGIAVPLVSHSAGNAWSDNTATAAARQDNFAFAWDERVAPAAVVLPRVHAAILATPLDTLSQSITIPTLRCDEKPAIDYDGAYYLLAWVRVVGCHSYPGLCSLSPLGARGPIFRLDTPLSDLVSAVDVACGTTNACVAYATWLPASALGAPQGHSAVGFFFVNLP
jgi:hypothetical protein